MPDQSSLVTIDDAVGLVAPGAASLHVLPLSSVDVKVFPDCLPDQSSLVTIDDVVGLVAPGQRVDLKSSTDGTVLPVDAMRLGKCLLDHLERMMMKY